MNKWKDNGVRIHFLDHWPFTKECRAQPNGGGWSHLWLAWTVRRQEQVFGLYYRLQCRFGRHSYALYGVGHAVGKECHRCKAVGCLTEEEIAAYQLPIYQPDGQEKPQGHT